MRESAQAATPIGFIDYVPAGSLAKGKALVTSGRLGKRSLRHLPRATLKGLGEVPGITGRRRSTSSAS